MNNKNLRYKNIQNWRQKKFKKKVKDSKYDNNGNCIYCQDIDFNGIVIDYYSKYDFQNRLIYKEVYKNNILYEIIWYEYFKDTNIIRKVSVFNNSYRDYKESYYDINSNITIEKYWIDNRIIIRNYQDISKSENGLYSKYITYSPFTRV